MTDKAMLLPALALIVWTLMVWLWMYAKRIPAMQAAHIDPQDAQHPGSLDCLPPQVRSVADNYNHLHEQPTVFYALMFYSHLTGMATQGGLGDTAVALAWAYVVFRITHSLIQNTVNIVMLRFTAFALSSLTLIALATLNLLFI